MDSYYKHLQSNKHLINSGENLEKMFCPDKKCGKFFFK